MAGKTNSSERVKKKKEAFKRLMVRPEVKSWRALMSAFQSIYSKLEKALIAEDCTISRFQILLVLYFEGPLSAAEISRRLLVTRGNMSMFLKRLKNDGLIEESPDSKSEKRALVCLTGAGISLFESVFPRHIERVMHLMPMLDPKMIETLLSIAKTR